MRLIGTTKWRISLKNCQECNETGLDNKMAMVFAVPFNQKESIDLNTKELDYDIKVMLKICNTTKPGYGDNIYDTVYLFGESLNQNNINSVSTDCIS